MAEILAEVPLLEPVKAFLGACPRCYRHVDGFELERAAQNDVVITLKPCGCAAHSSGYRFNRFMNMLKRSGSI
jgi:hypothetical protein